MGTRMPGVFRGLAIGLATAACLACDPGPSSRGGERQPLWIAVVQTGGALIPFARHGDDGWDLPWPAPFDAESGALADGGEATPAPPPDREAPSLPMPPVDQDSRGGRIAAPMQWRFYSQTERGSVLTVARLMLVRAHCMMSWALGFGGPSGFREPELPAVEGTPNIAGVAFSLPLEVVSAEDEIPALDRIRAELGLVGSSDPDDPNLSSRFVWLGFYRLDDGRIIGVVNSRLYEGESWLVMEIDGDQGRIAHRVYGGGC